VVPPGQLTESVWWSALAERVQDIVNQEPDPEEASQIAELVLKRSGLLSARDAGEVLVHRNLGLRSVLVRVMSMDPEAAVFPVEAQGDVEGVRRAIEDTDLETWVKLAAEHQQLNDPEWPPSVDDSRPLDSLP